jgi:hypothetical protein
MNKGKKVSKNAHMREKSQETFKNHKPISTFSQKIFHILNIRITELKEVICLYSKFYLLVRICEEDYCLFYLS